MNREVIQDFLSLPGIVGVALTNRRMRPYFYGLDSNLNGHQQQALGQGILQVVENIPEGFESFEFYFVGNIVFIYKLTHGLVLLVLTDKDLQLKNYQQAIAKVKQVIESDTYNAVATFKLVLGNVTQPSLPEWQTQGNVKGSTIPEDVTVLQLPEDEPTRIQVATSQVPPSVKTSPIQTVPATSTNTSTVNTSTKTADQPQSQEYELEDFVNALNKLSRFTTQYLGKVVVGNYWKSSRPANPWLEKFVIDRNAQISYPDRISIDCNSEEHRQLRLWTDAYMQRCKQVIRNFDLMVIQDCLDSQQQKLLIDSTNK